MKSWLVMIPHLGHGLARADALATCPTGRPFPRHRRRPTITRRSTFGAPGPRVLIIGASLFQPGDPVQFHGEIAAENQPVPGSRVAAHTGNYQATPQGDRNEALTGFSDHGLIPQEEEVVLRARLQDDSSGRIGCRGAGILGIIGNLRPIRPTSTYGGM